ncbi:hypothetical protein E4U55_006910 [Claviceps digitariae]|nr:hypothetical protein E4U55_006910 [Claviceps digitariae]
MKTTFTALGMLAAVASAYVPGRHLHFRGNGTEIVSATTTSSHPAPAPTDCDDASALPAKTTKVTDVVTDKTYIMTMGTGPGASLATKTYHTTLHETIVVTRADTTATPTATPTATSDRTTTKWSTTVITSTVFLHHKTTPTGTAGNSPASTSAGTCPVSTVTVTAAKETVFVPGPTVYVTVGGGPCTADQNSAAATQAPVATSTTPAGSHATDDCDETTPTLTPTRPATSQATSDDCNETTPTLKPTAPYPSNNGTRPTSGRAHPTGFARLRR